MLIDSEAMVNISDANQNFSKVMKLVDAKKKVVVMKNNKPKYIILEFPDENTRVEATLEEVQAVTKNVISDNANLLKRLAE